MDTAEFLKELYRGIPHGFAEIRLIHEEKHFIKQMYRPMPVTDINPQGIAKLHTLNQEFHVYHRMAISSREASHKSDVIMLPAVWLDIDDCTSEAYNRLLAMDFYPSIIIHSGGGFHAYWLLVHPVTTDSERAWFEIERTMEGMILAYGGHADPKTKDITRILRTPGFRNIKSKYPDKPTARVVFFDDTRYTFEALHNLYAPLGKPKQPQITRYIAPELLDRQLNNRVKNYLQSGAARGSRNSELYYCARAYLDAGYSQFDASNDLSPRARADGLSDSEIATTITSAYKNNANPTMNIPTHMRTFMAVEDTLRGES